MLVTVQKTLTNLYYILLKTQFNKITDIEFFDIVKIFSFTKTWYGQSL